MPPLDPSLLCDLEMYYLGRKVIKIDHRVTIALFIVLNTKTLCCPIILVLFQRSNEIQNNYIAFLHEVTFGLRTCETFNMTIVRIFKNQLRPVESIFQRRNCC